MVKKINVSLLNAGRMSKIAGVVIHNDAGSMSAEQYVNWLGPRDKALGIAHYYIDRNCIARVVDTFNVAWHTGHATGNGSYIGYEVCQSMSANDAEFLANEDRTLMQAAEDLLFYGLPIDSNTVKLHHEFVPTSCPHRSMALHGNSTASVKAYFIQRIKYFASLGKTVEAMIAAQSKPKAEIKPTAQIAINNINQKTLSYEVVISQIKAPAGLKEVLVPTWTSDKGQDDLIWHKATKQADGSYKYTVKASEHKNEKGKYISHVYLVSSSGQKYFIGDKYVVLDQSTSKGAISIAKDWEKGAFTVTVTSLSNSNGIKAVKLPTWTEENGQDDLKWYDAAKQADGSYKLTVRASDHKGSYSKYHVHGYIVMDNGQLDFFAGVEVDFAKHTEDGKAEEVLVVTTSKANIKHVVVSEEEFAKLAK